MPGHPEKRILGHALRGMGITETPDPVGNSPAKRALASRPDWSLEGVSLRENFPTGPRTEVEWGRLCACRTETAPSEDPPPPPPP